MEEVPLLDLKIQYQALRSEIDPVIAKVCETQMFILGPEVEKFEQLAADYCSCKYALGVSSGTDALLLALMALDIKPGDEVIMPPYTFFATAGSVARVGAKPVFVDIEPESFNLNPALIERAITNRTKVIMPVHLFGQAAEMDPILKLARSKNIAIVEDAAQAIGSEYRGRRAGSVGEIGCFSFFPSKNLGGFGDAGMVTCQDADLFDRLKTLRVHGSKVKYYHQFVGGNFRIDALQAAVLAVKLKHLDSWSSGRQRNAMRYQELFAEAGLISSNSLTPNPKKVVLPKVLPERRHIYNQYVIRVNDRDRVMKALKEHKIGCEVYYPLSLHQQECFSYLGYKTGDFPESERAASESLALPIYPELTDRQLQRVVEVIGEVI